MSLEATIAENTAALRDLIAAIGKGIPTTHAQTAETINGHADKPADAPTHQDAANAINGHADKPADAPTYQDAANAINALAKAKGRAAAVAVLAAFGAAKLSDVKSEQFADVIAAAQKA